ncbi:MAG: asparagine synthase-related protein [Candidatus Hodarchaeota archaeon]
MSGIWFAFNAPIQYESIDKLVSCQTEDMYNIFPKQNRILYKSQKLVVGSSTSEGYPISVYENQNNIVIVDGAIYGLRKSEQKYKLLSLCDLLTKPGWKEKCRNFVKQTDGEFIIIMINKNSANFVVFNDSLGRLSFYFSLKSNCLIAARSVCDIIKFLKKATLNNLAVTYQLLFEYPMDNGTFLKEIESWPMGHYIKYEDHRLSKMQPFIEWNFDNIERQDSFNDMAECLSKLLIHACQVRFAECTEKKILITLSGGFDSRIVAAILEHFQINFKAITRTSQINEYNEIEIAKKISTILGIDHLLFSVPDVSTDMMIKFAIAREGALAMYLAPILSFHLKVRKTIGSDVFLFTGLGGNATLDPFELNRKINSVEDMVNYFFESCVRKEIKLIHEITGVNFTDIKDNLIQTLYDYPERSTSGKFLGLKIRQRFKRWQVEGEDMKREVYWCTTPFYSQEFFKIAMSCPNEWKKNHKLKKAILEILNRECSNVPRSGYIGTSMKQRLFISIYQLIASNKWFLKTYRLSKFYRQQWSITPIPIELNKYLISILSEQHPLLSEVQKETLLKIISIPPTVRLRNRLISLVIALPHIWNSIGVYCR